ncbi:MAG: hypothetical protein M1308_02080 [Actinobacteria bacterium]|nr:hypothetical protein [Actinomycetota bacterium]
MIEKLIKIKADIFFTRYPIPDYRNITITIHISKKWDKEQIENKLIDTAYAYNNEITREVIREITFKEVKE